MVMSLIAALTLAAVDVCAGILIEQPVEGLLLLSVVRPAEPAPLRHLCLVQGQQVRALRLPQDSRIDDVAWAGNAHTVLVSACDPARGADAFCPVELTTIAGVVVARYPASPTPARTDAVGRVMPWRLRSPKISPDGTRLAVSIGGDFTILRVDDWATEATLPPGMCECAWRPDSRALACTRDSGTSHDCVGETQVVLYDLQSGTETRLTHFAPVTDRPWWNPFAEPDVHPAVVAGLSWARHQPVLGFYVVPDRGFFLWSPEGRELGRREHLVGKCWRSSQLSADAREAVYLSASRPELCLVNGGDEVRVMAFDGTPDRVVARVTNGGAAILDVDWWTE